MYGQTEAGPRMTYLPPDMLHLKQGSIGIPIPGGKIDFGKNKTNISNTNPGELIYVDRMSVWGMQKIIWILN